MSENDSSEESRDRFFREVPDLPAEALESGDRTPRQAAVDVVQFWNDIRNSVNAALAPPCPEGLPRELAAVLRGRDHSAIEKLTSQSEWSEVREQLRAQREQLLQCEPEQEGADQQLDCAEEALLAILQPGPVPVRTGGAVQSRRAATAPSKANRHRALLQLIAWLESL